MQKIKDWIKKEIILCISVIMALVSMFFVNPDRDYMNYIDYRTLAVLFSLMLVMAGYRELGVFKWLGEQLLSKVNGSRRIAGVFVLLCFFSSMLVTNDVALITFVPFAIAVLDMVGLEKLTVSVVVLQTIAANLGSMLTPVGNPQNLFLFYKSGKTFIEFIILMLPYTVVSFILIICFLFTIKNSNTSMVKREKENFKKFNNKIFIIYSILFFLCVITVAGVVSWHIALIIVILFVLFFDISIIGKVDYSLLFTFVGLFVFIGNMGRL